ncbi:MAG: type II toxin-antitoxin system death-on-curing family toxin [Phycisphaeraceae bacterium]
MLFLTLEETLTIHRDQIDRYGGTDELRDGGLLKSALAMPMAQFSGTYLHETPADMAAAYLYHLACNHPFVDGNKRVAAVAARVYLMLNGYRFDPPPEDYERLVLKVASAELSKEDVAVFISAHLREK